MDYKHQYESMKKMVTMYQDEVVPGLWQKIKELEKQMPTWVPVTERLPDIPDGWAENPEPVLYMMTSTRTIRAGYYGEGGVYRDKYFREYHDRYEGCDADDVLCWMWQHELPEGPKGE